jgi:hypothetical protein
VNDLILSLLFFISQQTGYHIPSDIQPQIFYASHSYFVDRFCDGVDTAMQPCEFVGMYINGKHQIYIDITNKGNEEKNSLLVHELTHFLQDVNHSHQGWSCDQAMIRENEAYNAENVYGLAHGVNYNPPPNKDDPAIICDHTIKD